MTRFNTATKKESRVVVNHEGEKAYALGAYLELYSLVCTCLMSDKFYESSADQQKRLKSLLNQVPHEFIAKLAVYAREKMHLRTIPLVLAVELAKIHKGDSLVSRMTERIIQRADEITEILGYYQIANNRKGLKKLNSLSKQIQKGLCGAFNKFEEYQFSKYNREGDISLRDALFIVHPKPVTKKQQKIFDKIAKDKLETAYTWETELSALGQNKFETEAQKAEAFKNKWEELIDSQKVGYMATLRNIRNILEAKVSSEHLQKVCDYLSNETAVLKSKQLPFRFYSAYKMLENCGNQKVLKALSTALKISCKNVPELQGTVLTAIDLSSSMSARISDKSTVSFMEIGAVLGNMFASKNDDNIVIGFGETMKVIPTISSDSILTNVKKVITTDVGHSTNAYLILEYALQKKLKIDNFVLFSDCQTYNSSSWGTRSANVKDLFERYKKEINPKARLIMFDVAGYGNTPIDVRRNDVVFISGWSDKVFDMLSAIQNGSSAVKEIEALEL